MADVIEDLQHVLQRTINYLSLVLRTLREKVHENRHRPLNHRTLVRWLATFYPKPKDPRVNVRMLRSGPLSQWGSLASLRSSLSTASLHQLLEEDLGDNMVRFRIGNAEDDTDISGDSRDLDPQHRPALLTSTPNRRHQSLLSSTSSSTFDPTTSMKISEMEEELAALRRQIALLVMEQETSAINRTDTEEDLDLTLGNASRAACQPLPLSPPSSSNCLDDSGCESESHHRVASPCLDEPADPPMVPPAPPPPPPPPPPPLPIGGVFKVPSTTSFADIVKKQQGCLSKVVKEVVKEGGSPARGRSSSVPVMADVLKDMGKIKLKTVARSPGGTPLRRKPLVEPTDPSAIIAQALRKKFAAHRGFSPDSDKENDQSDSFCSDTNSPFGQHLLKRTKRRLSLLNPDSSDNWTPVSSPLQPRNG